MRFREPTPAQVAAWHEWLAARPPHVRAVAERFDPWSVYRRKSTGQRARLISFDEGEDDTVSLRVAITAEDNFVMFERQVFGIAPDDLEPCELPRDGELTGAVLTDDQSIERYIDIAKRKMEYEP